MEQQRQGPARRHKTPWMKLVLIGVLAGLALFLQVSIWTLQVQIETKRRQFANPKAENVSSKKQKTKSNNNSPTREEHPLHRQARYQTGASEKTAGQAFWNLAVQHLDLDDLDDDSSRNMILRSMAQNITLGIHALQQAAKAGHPTAQFLQANALAAGFWPWSDATTAQKSSHLQVQDVWIDGQNDQMNQAWALWHMAAMAGNVEAAMALASRLEYTALQQHVHNNNACELRLPYLAAAAHGIIDELTFDKHSRAQVLPARDKHVLYQVHLHGGTGSRLDGDNRPDESPDAFTYYHVRASDLSDAADAARAAYSLARYYHYGLRGAPQNLTLACQYYTQAGHASHWEAAGQAGYMYLFGIGVEQDLTTALKLFRVGTLNGSLEKCQFQLSQKLKAKNSEDVALCDKTCLTGMGLLNLLGVYMLVPVNHELATQFLNLAKDQGDVDASYYLAMMKLGWKTHFEPLQDLESDGQTLLKDQYFPTKGADSSSTGNHPTVVEYQAILNNLATAAGKGHLQARHRLAMMYETGVTIPPHVTAPKQQQVVVARDCEKASKHYKSIIETACPRRAKRSRRAYKLYMAGELASSLRHYLAAAETGSELAMLNAAFLLEQGECLGMNRIDCAKASVRLWKAAATKGYSEASLRVGDFYYYGRFRPNEDISWLEYIVFPEELLPKLWRLLREALSLMFTKQQETTSDEESQDAVDSTPEEEGVCLAGETDGAFCKANVGGESTSEHTIEKDLASAAHYYRMAAERYSSPRAHFNLGFLYEWGLGLKQDFPLAKRHYDLAVSTGPQEAEVPVTIALFALRLHEYLVKKWMSWNWMRDQEEESSASVADGAWDRGRMTKWDVILKHIFSWESLLILALTIVLSVLLQIRLYRTLT